MWHLIQKYGGDPLAPNLETLQKRFEYRDFPHFIKVWSWKNQFLREYEDFTFIAEQVARDLVRQNHRYAEMMFSPSLFKKHGLIPQALTSAVRSGLNRVREVRVQLVADLVRDYGPEHESKTLEELAETREMGVIGIGIGGSEQTYPAQPFARIYERARELGFHTMAHAGEAAGPESVWSAIRDLQVERIGHGTRAGEDPALLDYLIKEEVSLDMCPLSNVKTAVVPDLAAHPVKSFFDRGVVVTINTDDPKMFGNSLAEEFLLLESVLNFNVNDIRRLTENAIRASWLPDDEKEKLLVSVLADPAWVSSSGGL
jgi:adenosine deaminase